VSTERELTKSRLDVLKNGTRRLSSTSSDRSSEVLSRPAVRHQAQPHQNKYERRSKTVLKSIKDVKHLSQQKPAISKRRLNEENLPTQKLKLSRSASVNSNLNHVSESCKDARITASTPPPSTYTSASEPKRVASSSSRSSAYPTTPSRPTVVVEIKTPRRQSPKPSKSASQSLLDKFRQPLPKPNTRENKSISLREAKQNREAYLLGELKKDTSIAQSRASTVEEVFGSHGLSKHYDDDTAKIAQRQALAQPLKFKKVNRSKVKLDWGLPEAATAFKPTDFVPPEEQANRLLDLKFEDVSSGAFLSFFNDRNDQKIDGKFQFINSYIRRGDPRKTHSVPADFGCTCSTQCDPADTTCRCFHKLPGWEKRVPYIKRPDGLTVLGPQYIDSGDGTRDEIFECNDTCKCSTDCLNRVVQKGRTIPLQIFMTNHCGFGIRSPRPIKKGQFIDVYLGELLTTKAIEDYESATTEKASSYVFSLDFFGPASYHVQGLHFGSPTRFINHSCNPNTRTFTVMMNHADQKVYKLAYFAIRDIPAMKEITFDYSPETATEEPWIPTPGEEDEGVVRCLCGENNCRGRIWPKRQAARRKGRGRVKI
jgi:[histone H3]-lysine9 N-trimethyltransferase SUV39H